MGLGLSLILLDSKIFRLDVFFKSWKVIVEEGEVYLEIFEFRKFFLIVEIYVGGKLIWLLFLSGGIFGGFLFRKFFRG